MTRGQKVNCGMTDPKFEKWGASWRCLREGTMWFKDEDEIINGYDEIVQQMIPNSYFLSSYFASRLESAIVDPGNENEQLCPLGERRAIGSLHRRPS
ncbi:hypothetical protein BT69DRAFT_734257 [Atractiella rhizophila]|nr:hypothetical protein BT69DRAFT_734257 [Atractiella rhizophila]